MEHQFNKHGKRDLMVPFEHYSFHAFTFAVDPITNDSVPITTFGIFDALGDFIIHSHDATGANNFTYESGDGLVSVEVESRILRAEIKRSVIAKAFAICLFLGNWAMTIGSVYTTALLASEKLEANSIITALPFSALLAIPTIRSLYSPSSLGISIGKPHACLSESIPRSNSILPDAVAFFVQTATIGLCCLALLRVLTRCRSSYPPGIPV